MDSVEYLVVGAGVTGLSFANWIRAEADARGRSQPEVLVLEGADEPGGYCKTIVKDGFVWDYSGHFFHFKEKGIEAWLRARMPGEDIRTVAKQTLIRFAGRDIDFPFQKNIHQLPRQDFIDCLYELYFREAGDAAPTSFKDMLYRRLGRGICERFLVPYNEKLYACDLDTLDADAMGRFFPHADTGDIIRNMRHPDNASYNATFTYPRGGAIRYIHALMHDLPDGLVVCGERLEAIDVDARVARTSRRHIGFEKLISSAPFDRQLAACGIACDPGDYTWNKVLVFNLGFDRKGAEGVHWMYFPDRSLPFYRVGWYDNIMGTDRMSLYVEIGAARDAEFDVEAELVGVLEGLRREGIADGHTLVSWHSVVLDPAYVHITQRSLAEVARLGPALAARGIHAAGRYGRWTYCSIEDNMIETRALARTFADSWPTD
jgi:protoporphyrinogen oxidase